MEFLQSWRKWLFVVGLIPILATGAETVEHEGAVYWIYRIKPGGEKLELFLSPKEREANTFIELQKRLIKDGKKLKFAVNAGIFEPNFRSSGLHISEGKTITALNLKDFQKTREGEFTPNFYLKPNGVFYQLEDGTAGILESVAYLKKKFDSKIRLANQSGPLLAFENKIHPIFTKDSTSRRHRNGVGVTPDGTIVFACTVREPRDKGISNLYNFATLFTTKLNCPNALYLDGDISYCYIDGMTPPLHRTNLFGGIFAVTQ